MSYTAEILAVGDELLAGSIANTNAQFLSRELSALGIVTAFHTVAGDDPARLRAAVEIARRRCDLLITVGGLGPTLDDLTKQTVCESFGQALRFHPEIAEGIRLFYREALHTEMPENNLRQAWLPEGGTVLPNAVGTAPGCAFMANGIHVLMLPGPPFELETMFRREAVPYLRALSGEAICSHDIYTFGLGESGVETVLRAHLALPGSVTLATYARPAEVRIRVTARAASEEDAEALLRPVLAQVQELLGDYVYGINVSGLPEQCLKLLKEANLTFATAESCTGGAVAEAITALPGASAVYRGGAVSYWTQVKADVLGVPQELLEEYGAVSEASARAMAEGARRITGADLAVSVTGVAGPDPDEQGNPVGRVFVGLATPSGTFCRHLELGQRRRDRIRSVAVNHAFDLIRRSLTGLDVEAHQTEAGGAP